MAEITGAFEIHVTVEARHGADLARFAERYDVKFVHIVLDRGQNSSQPMLSLPAQGTLAQARKTAAEWQERLRERGLVAARLKIEAAPWCDGLPRTEDEAAGEPSGRYFEHHVKLALPAAPVAAMQTAAEVGAAHDARLSRNARRRHDGGGQERFLTQRCHHVGLDTATQRLERLTAALRDAGLDVVEVEQEYVVEDSNLGHDRGWITRRPESGRNHAREAMMRSAPAGSADYPPTYLPVPEDESVRQTAAFDPAVQQYPNAYRAGEPAFADEGTGRRWRRARRAALEHALGAIARSRWAGHLVLRGSVTMAAWVGDAARDPGDLDFVVTPHTITSGSDQARELLDGITAALAAEPGAGLRPDRVVHSEIWTYERADGRRLAVPFAIGDGGPSGSIQIDVVFGEPLPLPPEPMSLPGIDRPVLAAPLGLALAWKLLWLATDAYPQGKDLYDAVLLAELAAPDLPFVRDLLRPELGAEADTFCAESVLALTVDWPNFTDEYPWAGGTAEPWRWRLALALERAWGLQA
ncbi:nucleotidyl transferase AbiEii/AbiGii toxin family protein [Dactylosporangium sp. NPDC000244]|uniref:nucleotidyl transferase AbiEii/AbiGii toxin family protein n=1 Tax=Dactylosporangium sp. NPDC000244 TaxID=3154365 RepID=UPI00332C9C9B